MRSIKQVVIAALAIAPLCAVPAVWADARNPYQTIVDRNPFGIKPPPEKPPEEPPAPVVPPAKVILTGVLNVLGPPRALLEITETEPGKAPVITKRTWQAGEGEGQVEVLSIDVEKAMVRIRNGKTEANIELAKATNGPAAPPPLGIPFQAPLQGQNGQLIPPGGAVAPGAAPLTFTPNNALNSARNAGVSTYGAPAAPAVNPAINPIPAAPNPFPVYPGGSTMPATTPNLSTFPPAPTTPGAAGSTSIPYRQPRTFPPTTK